MFLAISETQATTKAASHEVNLYAIPTGWAWYVQITGKDAAGIAPTRPRALSAVKLYAYSRLAYMPTDETKQACEAVIQWANEEGKR